MYHYVRPIQESKYPEIKGLELSQFRQQLDYLSNLYNPVTTGQVVEAYNGCGALPKNPVLLSFDDGYLDHFQYVFPELISRNITGLFFPVSEVVLEGGVLDINKIHYILAAQKNVSALLNYIYELIEIHYDYQGIHSLYFYKNQYFKKNRYDSAEVNFIKRMLQVGLPMKLRQESVSELFSKYVSSDEHDFSSHLYYKESHILQMLEAGMEFGSHGNGHPWMNQLSLSDQCLDINRSLEFLKRIGISDDGFYFCYPYGAYNTDTLTILRQKGCAAAFTVEPRHVDMKQDDVLELPRFDTNDIPLC